LACWFDADFVPLPATVDLARRAAAAGVGVAVGTNQERRRADHLREQLGTLFPLSKLIASAELGHRKPEPEFFRATDALLDRTIQRRSSSPTTTRPTSTPPGSMGGSQCTPTPT